MGTLGTWLLTDGCLLHVNSMGGRVGDSLLGETGQDKTQVRTNDASPGKLDRMGWHVCVLRTAVKASAIDTAGRASEQNRQNKVNRQTQRQGT